jgi:hypothetical protein
LIDDRKLNCHDKVVWVARKNCDKFITPTVRVSKSVVNYFVMLEMSQGHNAFFRCPGAGVIFLKSIEHNFS